MHSQGPQSLKFFWLRYEVIDIQKMLADYPELDYFVFPYYFPETDDRSRAFQLISYAYNRDESGDQYYGAGQVLPVFRNNALEVSGPLILSNNIISRAQMEAAIAPSDIGTQPDYLVLIPNVNTANYVYYTLRRHLRIPNAPDPQVPLPGGGIDLETNPSPPATMAPPPPSNG